jgi:hypothetical protein
VGQIVRIAISNLISLVVELRVDSVDILLLRILEGVVELVNLELLAPLL